jgi:hypothetical protein
MEPDFRIEAKGRRGSDRNGTPFKYGLHPGRDMNNPLARVFASFHCMAPLDQSRFFANVDFLTASDQTHHNTPFRDSFRKLDEMLRFGLRNGLVDVFFRDSILIPGPLGFVEDENVLGRN